MQNLPVYCQGGSQVSVVSLNKMRFIPYQQKNWFYIAFRPQYPYEFITGGQNVLRGQ